MVITIIPIMNRQIIYFIKLLNKNYLIACLYADTTHMSKQAHKANDIYSMNEFYDIIRF